MRNRTILLSLLIAFAASSCKKEAGEGGNSSIHGKVHTTHYDPYTDTNKGDYPATYYDVYIIYGDDEMYGDRTETNPEGAFEFRDLRPGNYRIYTYSMDIGPPFNPDLPDKMLVKEVRISKKKEAVDAGTFEIFYYDLTP